MKVAFWSMVHGQTATTSNMLAVSSMMALMGQGKTLMTHNHYDYDTLEKTLLGQSLREDGLSGFNDTGMDAVSRLIQYHTGDTAYIQNYATTIIKNRLDFLVGTRQNDESLYYQGLTEVIEHVLDQAKKSYDWLMVDVASGHNDMAMKILKSADVVVINLNQNKHVLDAFFERYGNHEKPFKRWIYCISLYDSLSKYNSRWIKKRYGIKEPVFAIPYTRGYADAINEGKVIEFFLRHHKADVKDRYYDFVHHVAEVVRELLAYDAIEKEQGQHANQNQKVLLGGWR